MTLRKLLYVRPRSVTLILDKTSVDFSTRPSLVDSLLLSPSIIYPSPFQTMSLDGEDKTGSGSSQDSTVPDSFLYTRNADVPLRTRARRNSYAPFLKNLTIFEEDFDIGKSSKKIDFDTLDEYGWPKDPRATNSEEAKEDQDDFSFFIVRKVKRSNSWWETTLMSSRGSGRAKAACRSGIPVPLRPAAWFLYSGAKEACDKDPDRYRHLLRFIEEDRQTQCAVKPILEAYIMDSGCNVLLQGNVFIKECVRWRQIRLKRLLSVVLQDMPWLQYSQFLSSILAFIFLVISRDSLSRELHGTSTPLCDEFDEESKAFWTCKVLLEKICPKDLLSDTQGQSFVDREAFLRVLHIKQPCLHDYLVSHDVPTGIIFGRWMQSCWINVVQPSSVLLRIFDALLHEGWKVIYRIGLAVCHLATPAILNARSASEATSVLCRQPGHILGSLSSANNSFKSDFTQSNNSVVDAFMKIAFEDIGSLPMSIIVDQRQACAQLIAEEAKVRRLSVSSRRMSVLSRMPGRPIA